MAIQDQRITLIEGLNARDLVRAHVPEPFDLLVCDVSFISLRLALPPALALAEPGADLIALIKPQFEVGRTALGKGGVVSSEGERARACSEVCGFLEDQSWSVSRLTPSPISGGDGNTEFLIAARRCVPA